MLGNNAGTEEHKIQLVASSKPVTLNRKYNTKIANNTVYFISTDVGVLGRLHNCCGKE